MPSATVYRIAALQLVLTLCLLMQSSNSQPVLFVRLARTAGGLSEQTLAHHNLAGIQRVKAADNLNWLLEEPSRSPENDEKAKRILERMLSKVN
uniref:Uncharacterized protein n=1 Tax=Plectus sambesii TaxID=2011161 RepID=A0A914VM00_9BILA